MTTQPSVWTDGLRPPECPPAGRDISCDVAVIGAGLAGVLTARFLQDAGADVVVLEKDIPGAGETGRTTAKITAQHGLIYHELVRSRGPAAARQYARANLAAIDAYEDLISTLPTDCGFLRCPAYLYTDGRDHRLQAEFLAAKQAGIDCALTRKTELPVPVSLALKFEHQARFRPLDFLYGVVRELRIYGHSPVGRVRRGTRCTRLETPGGTVSARVVVFAAHYPLVNVPGWYFTRLHQERSYVIALQNAFLPYGMYLGIDPDGLSFRQAGDYLLLGGGSHRTGEDPGHPYAVLEAQAKTLWPQSRVARRWSAQDCVTIDNLPYIGQYAPGTPDWFVATGFRKWGMTTSMVAARLLSDLILGRPNPCAALYDPARSLKGSMGSLMHEMGHAVRGLTRGLVSGRRCTHLGCQLTWNAAEGTWDCPCHGSRFAPDGAVLNNPATKEEQF